MNELKTYETVLKTAEPDRELAELLKDARAWLGMYANERTMRKHSETAFRLGLLCGKIDKVLENHEI